MKKPMEPIKAGGNALSLDGGKTFQVTGTKHILTEKELDKLIELSGGFWLVVQ